MPTTINNFISQPLKNIDFLALFAKALQANEAYIFELNNQQLDKGQDSEGKSLGRYANFKYKNRFQPVDLLLTGAFREKETLQINKKDAEVFSQDYKYPFLTKRYGVNIFGIQSALAPNLAEKIKPFLGELIKEQIFK